MDTRKRVVLSVIFSTIVFFLAISPLAKYAYDYITPPPMASNLKISTPSDQQINLKWESPEITDLYGYRVSYGDNTFDLPSNVVNYTLYGDEVRFGSSYSLYVIDENKNVSSPLQFNATFSSSEVILNASSETPFTLNLLILTLIIFGVVTLSTMYVLYFKYNKDSLIPVVLFPSLVTIPLSLLSISTLEGIDSVINKLIFSGIVSVALLFILYISFLTSNILNTAQKVKIPLEQAAKAVQFILNLIATYIVLIFAFGSYQNLILRLLVIIPFVFIYTYSSFWVSKSSSKTYGINFKTIGIVLLVAISVIVASFWPIDISYAILLVAVIYYILLNVALEMRVKYTKTLWIEYSALIVLLLILFLSNGSWGINFTII